MSHDQDYTTLKLASGEVRRVQSLGALIDEYEQITQKYINKNQKK